MTREELWSAYCAKNPAFIGIAAVSMTTGGLRKLFDTTWDRAHAQGVANGRALEQMERKVASNPPNSSMDALSEMFGFKK